MLATDFTGKRLGRLVAMRRECRRDESGRSRVFWECICDCGKTTWVVSDSLRKSTRSCGCKRELSHFKHGREKKRDRLAGKRDQGAVMLSNARQRAKHKGIEFGLTFDDVEIPSTCPVFGTSFVRGSGYMHPQSPSLDRIDISKGYVKGNVAVISWRANCIKRDAARGELLKVADYMERHGL